MHPHISNIVGRLKVRIKATLKTIGQGIPQSLIIQSPGIFHQMSLNKEQQRMVITMDMRSQSIIHLISISLIKCLSIRIWVKVQVSQGVSGLIIQRNKEDLKSQIDWCYWKLNTTQKTQCQLIREIAQNMILLIKMSH
jgi:hypothetical protein